MRDQHGVASRSQLRAHGASDAQLKRLTAAGVLEVADRGVLRHRAALPTWEQELTVAVLRAGEPALVSHRAAARLWQFEGLEDAPVELTLPHGRRVRGLDAILHHSTDLVTVRAAWRLGFRVTSAEQTLLDLGAVVDEPQLEVALDDAVRRGLTTVTRLERAVEASARPGRSGVPQLRRLLVARDGAVGVVETGFETLLLRALRGAGLPRPTTQHEIREVDGTLVMRVDAAYVEQKIGIEADSKRWHATDARFEDDREKRARAAALGWTIIAVTYRQVRSRPGWVGGTVSRALDAAQHAA